VADEVEARALEPSLHLFPLLAAFYIIRAIYNCSKRSHPRKIAKTREGKKTKSQR